MFPIRFLTVLWILQVLLCYNDNQSIYDFDYNLQAEWHKTWPLCASGKFQSPIDIKISNMTYMVNAMIGFENLERMYRIDLKNKSKIEYPFSILKVSLPDQQESIYQSTSINIKAPGEHSVNKHKGIFEIQINYQKINGNSNSTMAILAIRIVRTDQPDQDFFKNGLKMLYSSPENMKWINFNKLFGPASKGNLFVYVGSLSVPPCKYGVIWLIAEYTLGVEDTTVPWLSNILNRGDSNNRVRQKGDHRIYLRPMIY